MKDNDGGNHGRGEHPDHQRFVPKPQPETEGSSRQRPQAVGLISFHHKIQAQQKGQVLDGDRTPVHGGREDVRGIRGQQGRRRQSHPGMDGPAQEQIEDREARYPQQQRRYAQTIHGGLEKFPQHPIQAGFHGAQIAHHHQGDFFLEHREHEPLVRAIEHDGGENRLVGLDADVWDEKEPAKNE